MSTLSSPHGSIRRVHSLITSLVAGLVLALFHPPATARPAAAPAVVPPAASAPAKPTALKPAPAPAAPSVTVINTFVADPLMQQRVDALLRKTKADLVFIKGGSFSMGDFGASRGGPDQPEAKPAHEVKLDPFSIGRFKITHEDFDVFSDAIGAPRIAAAQFDRRYRAASNVPAGVNWHEAKAYCTWLASQTRLAFDLPTEAQWEFAARDRGKPVLWPTQTGRIEEKSAATSAEQYQALMPTYTWGTPVTHPVGKFPPSPLGLYDMGFNGWDWVEDWFDPSYYARSDATNPRGPSTGTEKVQRGSTLDTPETAITTYRQHRNPISRPQVSQEGSTLSERNIASGFRCVLNRALPVLP